MRGSIPLHARLDHLFILAESEAQALVPAEAGYPVVRHGPHRGGGTGNVVYRFRDALLELAYPIDPDEIAALGDIGFAERWRWRDNGCCPFGVVFQVARDSDDALPFQTWEYTPPFLPDSRWVIGAAPLAEPFYMLAPYDHEHPSHRDAPELASITIEWPVVAGLSPVATFLASNGICRIVPGKRSGMELIVRGEACPMVDMRPELPLVVRLAGR